jgi:hypothetical protein
VRKVDPSPDPSTTLRTQEREPLFTAEELRLLTWQPKKAWLPPKQISEAQRLEREQELIHFRRQEREAWAEEKKRLGL